MKRLLFREEIPEALGLPETQIADLAQNHPLPPMRRVCGVSFYHIADLEKWKQQAMTDRKRRAMA